MSVSYIAGTTPESAVKASYEMSVITFEEYAQIAIDFAKSEAEVTRRQKTDVRIQLLRDDWREALYEALRKWLTPEIYELVANNTMDNLDLSNNPAKHIWNDLSVLYKLPPKRFTPTKEKDIDKYNKLLEKTKFDLFWQQVELLLNACREVVIWPSVTEDGDGNKIIKHHVEAGNRMSVITKPGDKTEIEAYIQLYETKDKETHYRIWTDWWYGVFREDTKEGLLRVDLVDPLITPESAYYGANPYGKMPQVMVRLMDWQDKIWDETTGMDVVDLTLKGGRAKAFYRYMQKVSGFKQGVVTGSPDKEFEQLLDPAYLITIAGHDTNFSTVDWSVDLGAMQACMANDELTVAANYGINPQRYKSAGDYQTSFAAKSAERGLQEYREKTKSVFKFAEAEYRDSVVMIAKAHGIKKLPDPKTAMDVMHAPMAYPENPIIQADLDEREIKLGVSSQIEMIKRKNPQFTDEQAQQHLERIMENIAFVNDMKSKHNIADDPIVESQSAQENGKLGPLEKAKKKVEQENK